MTKLDGKTPDLAAENIEQLRQIFPDVFEDGKINFDKLKQALGAYTDDEKERYDFTWSGKSTARRMAQTPTTGALRPCRAESRNWDDTQNLYIEGDNLEVLKLLQKSYHGKVKMIYIDPPYNTGGDFVYPDDFSDSIQNYKRITGQVNAEGRKLSPNTESNGRYHTDWLNMMYPRLRLARGLLCRDGVIFISIDDNEAANLIKICDEIFGAENRIALICHKSRASVSNDKIISPNHNLILFYAKNAAVLESRRKYIGLSPNLEDFDLDDNDGRGAYRLVPVDGPGGGKKGNPFYEFLGIEGYWRFSKETMQKKYEEGLVVRKGGGLYQKYYKSAAEQTRRTATTWWDDAGLISTATSRLKALLGNAAFDTPKPLELIDRMLQMTVFPGRDSIVLDFFSGSATTAHAVMERNAEDGGNRRFIMVQLPEPCGADTEAAKAGYRNICEIGRDRIRRAGEKLRTEIEAANAGLAPGASPKKVPDTGFRVFRLDSSNLKKWQPDYDDLEASLFDSINNYVEGRSELDVVYEILLKMGMELTCPLETRTVAGRNVYVAGAGALMICLDNHIAPEVAEGMAVLHRELAPETWRVVFKDNGFADDSAKVNVKEILKRAGLEEDSFTTV